MSALDGFRIRILTDGVPGQYAAWLLRGLGAAVGVVSTVERSALPPVGRWLTARCGYLVDPDWVRSAAVPGDDALIIDAGPHLDPALAAAFRALETSRPGLVATIISPYGLTGPMAGRRATHHEIQATSGLLCITGDVDEPPVPVGGDLADMAIGANAAFSVLAGLWRKLRTGAGASIDLSALETIVGLQASRIITYAECGLVFRRTKADSLINFVPCADGFVNIYLSYTPLDEFLRFLEIDESDWPAELFAIADKAEQFAHPTLLAIVKRALAGRTRQELVERGVWWRIPVTPAMAPADHVTDEHMAARGYLFPLEIAGQTVKAPAYPFKGAIWDSPDGVRADASIAGGGRLPLEGLRVAEFGLGWAAPMTAEILAMYGAEVLKVESPNRIDTSRVLPLLDLQVRDPWWEHSVNYHPVHNGKLHFGLDIKGPQGRAMLRRLIERTDLAVTNFSVRALHDLGLDGPALQDINPRISVVNSTGYGLDGPYHEQGAYGSGMEGVTGIAWATGGPAGLIRSQLLHPDIMTALHAVTALVASLFRREKTGAGTAIDISQFELGALAVAGRMIESQLDPAAVPPPLLRLRLASAGDDEWVAVTLASQDEWTALLSVLGAESAPAFAEARIDARATADRLSSLSSSRSKHALADALQAAGLPAEPVLAYDEACEQPQLAERNYFLRSETKDFGKRVTVGRWFHFHDTDVAPLDGVHRFGSDNHDVLTRILGCTDAEAKAIVADGTVGIGPVDRPSLKAASSPIDWMLETRVIYRVNPDFRERMHLT